MRTNLAYVVLLLVGSCCAFPQYGPPRQEEEQQVAVVPEPVVPVDATVIDQQKEKPGAYWWQNQGVFTEQNPGGTVVVVKDPSPPSEGLVQDEVASSPFIPSPSPDCDEYHGCIPWQFCVDGVFTNTGEGLLALRSPSKVPETYTQKLCGQIGNICCRIPEAILAAQQQGPSIDTGSYSAGSESDHPADGTLHAGGALPGVGILPEGGILDTLKPAIIEIISSGDVLGPVVEGIDGSYDIGAGVASPGAPQTVSGSDPAIDSGSYGVDTGSDLLTSAVGTLPGVGIQPESGILDALKPEITDIISGGDILGPVVGESDAPYDTSAPGPVAQQTTGGSDPSTNAGSYGTGTGGDLPAGGSLPVGGALLADGTLPGAGIQPDGGILDALKPAIIEVISSGDVLGPAVEGIDGSYDTGAGAAGPGVPQVTGNSGGILVDPAIGVAGPGVEQVVVNADGGYGDGAREDTEQQPVESIGIVETTDTGCPAYTHDCVPYFQCIEGDINTSGVGLIDVRLGPKKCINPEYPEVPAICCRIPGVTPPPTSAPIQVCPGTQVCVADSQCNYDGTVNTDGTGLINTRLRNTCYLSYEDATNYETGVCCQPPAPVDPAPLVTCHGTQVCVAQGQCLSQTSAGADYSAAAVTSCYYRQDQTVVGECCDAPITPVVPEPLDPCPGTQECVEEYQCKSDGTVNTDGTGLINTRIYTKPCYIDTVNYVKGVCCQPPTPPAPEPIVTCPGNQVCLSTDQCTRLATIGAATGSSYNTCVLDSASYTTGVCCDSPVRAVDVCPGNSVCIPDILCQGEILTTDDQYKPYGITGDWTWSQCLISGDIGSPGICCRNPEPVVASSTAYPETPVEPANPYIASDRCGERNYGLDLRSPVKLAKNEAQFGEFPWQAIIFFTNYTFKCGASLIEDKWLITAAHCINGYNYGDFRVRLGEWQVDKYEEPLAYVDVDIASITIHPDFKPGPVHNDIALIELTAPVTLQYHINRVCLPGLGQKPAPGTRCFASGWGKDAFDGNYQPILKKVDVPYVDHAYCQDLLRQTRLGKYFILDKSFMCAGGEENIDACEGDGGGPLVCKDETAGIYYLAGITAWGIDCGQKDVPGVYADVQLFRPWIDGIVYGEGAEQFEQQVSSGAYGGK